METLRERIAALKHTWCGLKGQKHAAERPSRFWRGAYLGLLGLGLLALLPRIGTAQPGFFSTIDEVKKLIKRVDSLETKVSDQEKQIAALQKTVGDQTALVVALQKTVGDHTNTLKPLALKGDNLIVTGVNLQIQNKTGATDRIDGTGNLIIGQNVGATVGGSHNLVIGNGHNYQAAFGGLVVGLNNTIGAGYASVTGGSNNVASGYGSSVSGGERNTVRASFASVSGGQLNRAFANYSSISGGLENNTGADEMPPAEAAYASVSGGANNQARGRASSVSGGQGVHVGDPRGWKAGSSPTFASP